MKRPDRRNNLIKNMPVFFKDFNQLSEVYLDKNRNVLSIFLEGFQRANDKAQSIKYTEYTESDQTQVFFKGIKTALQTSRKLRVQEIPDFNIFNVLRISRREVVATAMWKDLLDPKGSHEQGDLFLLPFLELLDNKLHHKNGVPYTKLPTDGWITSAEEFVHKEHPKDKNGRIDVYLKHLNDYSAIAIEYKIDAEDQERQVSRYYEHLKTKRFNQWHVIYITPTGADPSGYSLGKLTKEDMAEKVVCMSIKYELVPILKQILESNNKMPVALRCFIENYIEVAQHD